MVAVTQNTTYMHDGTDSTLACPKMLSLLNYICTLDFFDKLVICKYQLELFILYNPSFHPVVDLFPTITECIPASNSA